MSGGMGSAALAAAANQGGARRWWLAGGAFAMGSGIWCMHYMGMRAFRLPMPVYYHVLTVVLSLVAAVVASSIGLYVVSRDRVTAVHLGVGSVLMGGAIATMHYTGMAAVRFRPMAAVPGMADSMDISTLANVAILVVTIVILGFALLSALTDRWILAQQLMLEDERKMLRALIDSMPDFMYVKDRSSRFLIANPQLAWWAGVKTPQEMVGRTDADFFPREQAEAAYESDQRVMQSGVAMFNREEEVTGEQGRVLQILTIKVPLRDAKGQVTGIAGVGRDISERKRYEEALRRAEMKYRTMFSEALVGICRLDAAGCLLDANPALGSFLGYESADEMIATLREPLWAQAVLAGRGAELVAQLEASGQVRGFDLEVARRDGSRIWVSASVRAIVAEDGVVGYEGMFEDITERRLLREQLLQAQKLESVGQLAAGIAHEINTPTQYIGDNVRFLQESFAELMELLRLQDDMLTWLHAGLGTGLAKDVALAERLAKVKAVRSRVDFEYLLGEVPHAIEQTLEGVARVSTLVSAMKEFSHLGTKEKIPLDLNHAIQSTLTVARNEWKYVAEMETAFDRSLPLISCHPGEFNQVILNLIVNAAHAIAEQQQKAGAGLGNQEKGKIRVETTDCPRWVEIRVGDTGAGIPAAVRSRIFDPFFTTKEIGKGTGQGLAIARSVIVDKHAGSIDFETAEGRGTTFLIRLPHDGESLQSLQGLQGQRAVAR
jgi:two-component system, NtrC family, sensor kinase